MLDNILAKVKSQARLVSILFIIIVGFSIYANSLGGEFVWDDQVLVEDNLYIRDWSSLSKFFTSSSVEGSGSKENLYRPVQMGSYALDYSIWKLDVRGYHLTNIILHILVALALYWFCLSLFKDNLLSFLAAVFFVVHPTHTEVVAYISGRADSLAALFLLLSFIFYLRYLNSSKFFLAAAVIVSYILALFSRESALIFPVALLLYHWLFKKRLRLRLFLILSGLSGFYIVLRLFLLNNLLPQKIIYIPLAQRAFGFLASLPQYLRLLVFPFWLHMEYGQLPSGSVGLKSLLGIAFLTWFLIYVLRKPKKEGLVLFSLSWFLLLLLPQSNLYPVNAYMAEHWLYLPSVGFFFILAAGLSRMLRIKKIRILAGVFIFSLLVFYSWLTVRQNNHWANAEELYSYTLGYGPKNSELYNNLASIYQARGETEKAVSFYGKAIQSQPDYADANYNLAVTYHQLGKMKEAVQFYAKAIKSDPEHAESMINLATIYYGSGRRQEAIALYKQAVKIRPNHPVGHVNLAIIYYYQKQYDLADYHRSRVIELNYKDPREFLPELDGYQLQQP